MLLLYHDVGNQEGNEFQCVDVYVVGADPVAEFCAERDEAPCTNGWDVDPDGLCGCVACGDKGWYPRDDMAYGLFPWLVGVYIFVDRLKALPDRRWYGDGHFVVPYVLRVVLRGQIAESEAELLWHKAVGVGELVLDAGRAF